MNSSTSTSEFNRGNEHLRLCFFLILVFGLLGAASGIVAWFDCYDWFGRRGYVAAAPRSAVHPMLGKIISLNNIHTDERNRVEVMVSGDSRARRLTIATKSAIDGHLVVNGGVGGLSIEESLEFLENQVSRFPSVKKVILLTPFERICQNPTPARIHEVIKIADSLTGYLLNWENLKLSLSAWRYSPTPRGYDGGVLNEAVARTTDREVLELSRQQFRAYNTRVADQRVAAIGKTVLSLKERGMQVVLWVPPLRADAQIHLRDFGLEAEEARIAGSLRKIAPLVDSLFEPSIGDVSFVFMDPVHTENGPAILAELLRFNGR